MSRTELDNKIIKHEQYADVNVIAQLRATNALLKFCYEHERIEGEYVNSIQACAKALESKDIKGAVSHFLNVPLGGNGCFNDWWPPVVYEHETDDYVWAVFEALTRYWSHIMSLSVEK